MILSSLSAARAFRAKTKGPAPAAARAAMPAPAPADLRNRRRVARVLRASPASLHLGLVMVNLLLVEAGYPAYESSRPACPRRICVRGSCDAPLSAAVTNATRIPTVRPPPAPDAVERKHRPCHGSIFLNFRERAARAQLLEQRRWLRTPAPHARCPV